MSEVLLQTIVEKLEAFGGALSKPIANTSDPAIQEALLEEIKLLQSKNKVLEENLKLNNESMQEVITSVNAHTFQLKQPVNTKVEYKHQLHKGVWIAVGLFLSATISTWGWIDTYQSKKGSEANDIKYRSMKISGNKTLIRQLYDLDNLYIVHGEAIKQKTIAEENRLAEQAKMLQLAGEKEKEFKELKRKAGKKL